MIRAQVRLEGATDLEAGAGALAKGCPALRDVSFSRAPRLSADALEPLFGLGRLQSLVLVTCPNVGDALLEATQLCHPCARMEAELGPGGVIAMFGYGGLCAKVIQSGAIECGATVRLEQD